MGHLNFGLSTVDEIATELGARLKVLRLAQGLQQGELASRAGVSRTTVTTLENQGQTTLASLLKVVMALGREADLEPLFEIKIQSIAQMEQAEAAKRMRAPRKYSRKPSTLKPTSGRAS